MNNDIEIRKGLVKDVPLNYYVIFFPVPFIYPVAWLNPAEIIVILFPFLGLIFFYSYNILAKRYFRIIKRTETISGIKKVIYRVETLVSISNNASILAADSRKWSVECPGCERESLKKAKEYFDDHTLKESIKDTRISPISISKDPPLFRVKWIEANKITELLVEIKIAAVFYLLPLFVLLMFQVETTKKNGISMMVVFYVLATIFGIVKLLQLVDIKLSKRYFRIVESNIYQGNSSNKELNFQSYITVRDKKWVERNESRINWKNIYISSFELDMPQNNNSDREYMFKILEAVTTKVDFIDEKIN